MDLSTNNEYYAWAASYEKRHKVILNRLNAWNDMSTSDRHVYNTQIHLFTNLGMFLIMMYFRYVRHQYFENCDYHGGFHDIEINFCIIWYIPKAVDIVSYRLSLSREPECWHYFGLVNISEANGVHICCRFLNSFFETFDMKVSDLTENECTAWWIMFKHNPICA